MSSRPNTSWLSDRIRARMLCNPNTRSNQNDLLLYRLSIEKTGQSWANSTGLQHSYIHLPNSRIWPNRNSGGVWLRSMRSRFCHWAHSWLSNRWEQCIAIELNQTCKLSVTLNSTLNLNAGIIRFPSNSRILGYLYDCAVLLKALTVLWFTRILSHYYKNWG